MTATPIPRSYALALYGDLDLSLIKEMPKERKKIITRLVEPVNRQKAYDFIRGQIGQGRQVFVICPLIEKQNTKLAPSMVEGYMEKKKLDDRRAVKEEYERLKKEVFSDLKIGMLHGKMQSKEKEKIMQDFLNKKIDILVSTSVVEVGVDIPNASIMMIEGAERFGLAQLHQFRGRVGRAEHQSYCLLFTSTSVGTPVDIVGATLPTGQAGLPTGQAGRRVAPTMQRLQYLVANQDGFALAEKDLELRGPGEVFGTIQHGFPELKIADLRDLELIKKSREVAKELLDEDPDLERYPAVCLRLAEWEKEVHLE